MPELKKVSSLSLSCSAQTLAGPSEGRILADHKRSRRNALPPYIFLEESASKDLFLDWLDQ